MVRAISIGQTVTLTSGARVTLLADGTLEYDQNGAFNDLNTGETGNDSFTYRTSDGLATDQATVSVTINGATDNAPPTAVNDAATVDEDATVNGSVLDNDNDTDGGTLTVTSVNGGAPGSTVTLASGATVVMQVDGTYVYDPNGAFDGLSSGQTDTDSFVYSISDGQGGSDTATVNITINGVSAPVTENPFTIDFEAVPNGTYLGENGLDVTGITAVQSNELNGAKLGLIAGSPDAVLTFSAGTFDFDSATFTSPSGRVRVTVEAFDENGVLQGSSTFNIRAGRDVTRNFDSSFDNADTIVINARGDVYIDDIAVITRSEGSTGGNQLPQAVNDIFSVAEGADPLQGNMLSDNGFGADSDPDGDTLTVLSVNGDTDGQVELASGATVTFNPDGSFDYFQNDAFVGLFDGETGNDSFVYTVSDGNGGEDTATVSVEIQGSGTPPPGPVTTVVDFESPITPDVDGYVFTNLGLTSNGGDGEGLTGAGNSFSVSRLDGSTFSFEDGFLRAESGKNVNVTIVGRNDLGDIVATETVRLRNKGDTDLQLTDPGFASIDSLEISASVGLFADDLTFVV